jgi:ATP-dependent Clp protease adaptor protein ClpS
MQVVKTDKVKMREGFGALLPVKTTIRMQGKKGEDDASGGTGTVTLTRTKTKKPSMYKVLLLNDDYTPMEFVIYVLQRFFSKSAEDATEVMLHVHQNGVGICGVFTYEVAETKVTQVMDLALQHDHPLQCTMEKD